MEKHFRLLARIKAWQARGGSYVQFILNFGIITANVALFSEWFVSHNIPVGFVMIVCGIMYLFGTTFMGYLDNHYGIWKHEAEFTSNVNPFLINLDRKVSEISEVVKNEKPPNNIH